MASAVSPRLSTAFDLTNPVPYPIRFEPHQPPCSTIQYNHKPLLSHPDTADSQVVHASDGSRVTLSLKDGHEEYKYSGRRHGADDEYLLLLDESRQEFLLQKLASSYALNLTRAPSESDSSTLAQRYPQLRSDAHQDHDDDDDHEDDDDDPEMDDGRVTLHPEDAETDNPFDFRHYLHVQDLPSPALPAVRPAAAPAHTPAVSQTSTRTNTPLTKSIRKQPAVFAPKPAKVPPKPRNKQKPTPQPEHSTRSPPLPEHRPQRRTEAEVPAVRVDPSATTGLALPPKPPPKERHVDDELSLDSGDLILEGAEPQQSSYTSNHSKSSLGLAFSNGLGDGPRSLRSAASSPAASHIHSPASQQGSSSDERRGSNYDEDELIMDPDEEGDKHDRRESGGEEDDDVDALELPSPAQVHRPSIGGATVTGDDDLDLEDMMRQELEGGLEEYAASGPQAGADSDEESEEE
jgi:hypothetical protein